MISICRACSHTICRHRIGPSRLTHSSFVRLLEIDLRVIRTVPSSSSFIRYGAAGQPRRRYPVGGVSDIPTACGLAFISPLIRYGRRGDDVPGAYQSEDGIDVRRQRSISGASFIPIRSCSRSPTPSRPASSLIRYEKRDGGLFVVPCPVVFIR